MPIVEKDPWRDAVLRRASPVRTTSSSRPTTSDAYRLYPAHRWVYNKLLVCETQGLEHGAARHRAVALPRLQQAHLQPPRHGRRGTGAPRRREEYERAQTPGHLWMPLLTGEHVSTDVALVDGEPCLVAAHDGRRGSATARSTTGRSMAEPRPALEASLGAWLRRHLARLHRLREPRDHRRHDHRVPPPLRRPVGRSLRRRLARERRRALRARPLALRRRRAADGVQRRPLRRARACAARDRRRGGRAPAPAARRLEHPDHLPRRPAARARTRCRPAASVSRSSTAGTSRRASLVRERLARAVPRRGPRDPHPARRRRTRRERRRARCRAAVREIEHCWIPLPDGCRLAARIWLPEDADGVAGAGDPRVHPVPQARPHARARRADAPTTSPGHGYAAVRVDVRGTGDSDGLLDGRVPRAGAGRRASR